MNKVQVLIIAVFIFYRILENATHSQSAIKVLDVGQGDALLLRLDNNLVLVDGGSSFELDRYLSKEFIGNYCAIDLIILSHPHADHVKGLNRVLKRCQVDAVAFTDIDYTSNLHKEWQELVSRIPKVRSTIGAELLLGDFSITFIWPKESYATNNINNASLSFVLQKGRFDALFVGDLESDALELIEGGPLLELVDNQLDFYKVPHHGSRGSIHMDTLHELSPKLCAISAGFDNKFGHPHKETLAVLHEVGCQILRTDLHGTIELLLN